MDERVELILKVHKMVMDNHRARLILLERLLLKGPKASLDYFDAVKDLEEYLLSDTAYGTIESDALIDEARTRSLDSFVGGLAESLQESIDQAHQAIDPKL